MIDIQFVRDNPQIVKDATKNKQLDSSIVDEVIQLDQEYKQLLAEVENLRASKNQFQKEIKNNQPSPEQIIKGKNIRNQLNDLESKLEIVKSSLQKNIQSINWKIIWCFCFKQPMV